MVDQLLANIEHDIARRTFAGHRPAVVRLESSVWNAIRRSFADRPYVFPTETGERRRPRLFGVDVVVDESLWPGTWRLEA